MLKALLPHIVGSSFVEKYCMEHRPHLNGIVTVIQPCSLNIVDDNCGVVIGVVEVSGEGST